MLAEWLKVGVVEQADIDARKWQSGCTPRGSDMPNEPRGISPLAENVVGIEVYLDLGHPTVVIVRDTTSFKEAADEVYRDESWAVWSGLEQPRSWRANTDLSPRV